MDSVEDSQEPCWEQLEIPGLLEQLPNLPTETEESVETEHD